MDVWSHVLYKCFDLQYLPWLASELVVVCRCWNRWSVNCVVRWRVKSTSCSVDCGRMKMMFTTGNWTLIACVVNFTRLTASHCSNTDLIQLITIHSLHRDTNDQWSKLDWRVSGNSTSLTHSFLLPFLFIPPLSYPFPLPISVGPLKYSCVVCGSTVSCHSPSSNGIWSILALKSDIW